MQALAEQDHVRTITFTLSHTALCAVVQLCNYSRSMAERYGQQMTAPATGLRASDCNVPICRCWRQMTAATPGRL